MREQVGAIVEHCVDHHLPHGVRVELVRIERGPLGLVGRFDGPTQPAWNTSWHHERDADRQALGGAKLIASVSLSASTPCLATL